MKRATTAIAIAVVLTAIPFVLDWFDLPTSFVEFLFVPGMLCASVFYPEGTHTGSGHPEAFLIAGLFNILVYSTLFYLLMKRFGKPKHKAALPNDEVPENGRLAEEATRERRSG